MKTKLLVSTLFLTMSFIAIAQDKLEFGFDNAGNQIRRSWVCVNCAAKSTETKKIDSTEIALTNDNNIESKINAYPNPVSNILQVEWIDNPIKRPNQIVLFSMDSKKIFEKPIKNNKGVVEIPFERYSSGMYILMVLYTNGEKETFNILKN